MTKRANAKKQSLFLSSKRSDYDSPWKELLERYFQQFMEFFFPQATGEIDWGRGYEFLDKELQRVTRRSLTGRHTVDKLVKVWLKDGTESWLLIHIEIQSQREDVFAERMFVYNYRLFDRYKRQIVSLAILADSNEKWRPQSFGYARWGCAMRLDFPSVKLLDYWQRWEELEQSQNPFALAVMAHLRTLETRRKPQERLRWKIELVRILYERGYSRENIYELLRFIDWLMDLPKDLELEFEERVDALEEKRHMKYIPTFERRAIERGLTQGLEQGLEQGLTQGLEQGSIKTAREDVIEILTLRFQLVPQELIDQINHTANLNWLKQQLRQAILAPTLEDFERMMDEMVH